MIFSLLLSVVLIAQYFVDKEAIADFALKFGYMGIMVFSLLLEVSFQLIGPDLFIAVGVVIKMNPFYLLASIITGSFLAGFIGYHLGRVYGEPILHYTLKKQNMMKAINIFQKYGKFGLTILALTPLPYFPILGGIFRLSLKDFMVYALVPRAIRYIGLMCILSYIS
ncbi:membrane protein YqaA with SNARE-associated domain [Desulfobotulus alkaliphilus]|uniref:Membrane protein YqaA with SNARE-associated domain n=2 Tax=Desulfobotulus alkaliphilus TaxID=622671 RepID=A0A562RY08_9BACT|nr:membrane protein YqaA with SNARE-associated domain [Desulfobotulus alkaliphilus]